MYLFLVWTWIGNTPAPSVKSIFKIVESILDACLASDICHFYYRKYQIGVKIQVLVYIFEFEVFLDSIHLEEIQFG